MIKKLEFENGRKLRKHLKEKFPEADLKKLGVKIRSYDGLGIYTIDLGLSIGSSLEGGNFKYLFDEDGCLKLNEKDKELIEYIEKRKFYIKYV